MEITSKNQIIDYFSSGCKEDLLIGVENEKFLFREEDQQRVNYSDIKKVLNLYSEKYKWEKIFENKNLIGLKLGGKSITLEPGNQIELSGDKYKNIHGVCSESYDFQSKLNEICKNLKLKTIAVGHDPYSKLSEVPNNPKQRYEIMTKEMPKNGKQSLNMMYQTSGTQINIDYSSEEDFKKKFKVISFLIPITIGVFANSAISENKPSGYLSLRSKVWQETARGGLPEIFLEDMDFEKYADFAINFPLLFLKKNNLYTSANGKKFKDFMEGKIENIKNLPNLGDLELHLSTIFTENRLKKYIEIRSLDACEWDCHCAGPAFLIGLIYGNLESTISIINKWKKEDVLNAYIEAPKKGLNTIINNKKILDWLKIFYDISKNGLEKRKELNKTKRDESIFLNNIKQILNDKKTKADKSLEKL
tara:strand:+ start:285 stop:1541 length:1257 start_codon:yes stop_codon:yes gene_type:complete